MTEVMVGGSNAARNRRRELIRLTVEAWIKCNPVGARAYAHFFAEMLKVENKGGDWQSRQGYVKVRLPQDLYQSLCGVFNKFLPQEPAFAYSDDDFTLMYEMFPKLIPSGVRKGRGRKRRQSK